jgi:4-hydroxybenzoate polyprenyltransferase
MSVRDHTATGRNNDAALEHGVGGAIERWYASWGTRSPTLLRLLLAHIRATRPTTRLWLDTLMPLALIAVLTDGHMPWRVALLTVAAMNCLHVGATFVNDVKDRETDGYSREIVRRTRPITVGLIAPRAALVEAVVFVVVGLGLTALVRWQLTVVAVVLAALIAQHELPPVRTQGRPVVSQVAGLIGLIGIVASIVVAVGVVPLWHTIPYLLYVVIYLGVGEMLVKDVRDSDNDAVGGKITTSVKYGPANATLAASAAYVLATACWIWLIATAPSVILVGWLLVGSGALACWIVFTLISARQLRASFTKVLARRLHRGSALTFSVVSGTLLAGYLL